VSKDLLTDVLRAEATQQDLQEDDQGNIVVCSMRKDGSLYELGHVTMAMACQDKEAARMMISRIKFLAR